MGGKFLINSRCGRLLAYCAVGVSLFFSTAVLADCYVNCDSISRNLSTDYAKLIEQLKADKYEEHAYGGDSNASILCKRNDKNELEVMVMRKNPEQELMRALYLQFTPPDLGGSKWQPKKIDLVNLVWMEKTLNFGLSGINDNLSEDKRCLALRGENGFAVIQCDYKKDANLPVTQDAVREQALMGSSDFFIEESPETACKGSAPLSTSAASAPSTSSSATSSSTSGQYVINGDGTVTDTKTSLMWKQCSEGQSGDSCSGDASQYKWDDAMSKFGSGVSFAGHSDWRIPTKDELKSLVYCSNGTSQATAWNSGCSKGGNVGAGSYQSPAIDHQAFPNTHEGIYWSSTEGDAAFAWAVYFDVGAESVHPRNIDGMGGVARLVRSGQ